MKQRQKGGFPSTDNRLQRIPYWLLGIIGLVPLRFLSHRAIILSAPESSTSNPLYMYLQEEIKTASPVVGHRIPL